MRFQQLLKYINIIRLTPHGGSLPIDQTLRRI